MTQTMFFNDLDYYINDDIISSPSVLNSIKNIELSLSKDLIISNVSKYIPSYVFMTKKLKYKDNSENYIYSLLLNKSNDSYVKYVKHSSLSIFNLLHANSSNKYIQISGSQYIIHGGSILKHNQYISQKRELHYTHYMCIATNYTKPESHKDFVCLYLKSFVDEDVQFYRLIKKIGKFINTQEVRDIDELVYVNNDRFKRDLIIPYRNNVANHQYSRNSILQGILQTLIINEA